MPYTITINQINGNLYGNINVPSLTLPYCDFCKILMDTMMEINGQLNVYSPNFISEYVVATRRFRGTEYIKQFQIIDNSNMIYPYHTHINYDQDIDISQTLIILFSEPRVVIFFDYRISHHLQIIGHLEHTLSNYMITKLNVKSTDKCYDPVCGHGRFLIGFAHAIDNFQFIQNNIFGNEINNNKYIDLVDVLRSLELESCLSNIQNTNSLSLTQHEAMKEKFDIIVSDIPFGSNDDMFQVIWYPIRSKYIHVNFMQHIFFSLKAGGKAAVIIPTRILSNNTDIEISLRKLILECCQITEIIDLPTVSTPIPRRSIIFFTKYRTTTNIKYTKYSSMNNLGLFYHDCSIKIIPKIDIITNDYKIVFE